MIKNAMLTAAVAGLLAACATAPTTSSSASEAIDAAANPDPAIEVMVLGSYHMSGSTADVVNMKVDNVLTPKRQAELKVVADALAKFNPTMVVVERESDAPDYVDPYYADYDVEMLASVPNERVQIGYRLAAKLGLPVVRAIDEQPAEGEPDYFPFDRIVDQAENLGRTDELNQAIANVQAFSSRMEEAQAIGTVADLLIMNNDMANVGGDFYYSTFDFDLGEVQPGAELQAYWFMRNAKIFSKVYQLAEPGERVLIIYGSGHKYWLQHFAQNTPGYRNVDPRPYLEDAAAALQ